MKPTNNIEKAIRKKLNFSASAEMRERILTEVINAQEDSRKTKPALNRLNIRNKIMKNPITKLAAAAVIIIAVLIATNYFGGPIHITPPVYGITEALEIWQNAEIVHIGGWNYLHTGDDTQLEKFPFELWFDKKNGRFRDWHPVSWFGDYTTDTPKYYLTVSDGIYIMETSWYTTFVDNKHHPQVSFTKLSPFQQHLQIHTMEFFPGFMCNLNEVKGFVKVGREQFKNKTADIWEGEIASPGETVPYKKYKIWLSPFTGEILRIFRWANPEEDCIRWVSRMDAHTIEYNVKPPVDCFKTEAPEGYKLTNTKETATEEELGNPDGVRFHDCIGFTLKEGSVIYGWHANHRPEESQAHLFTNLKQGGPLPKLPAQIVVLKPWPVEGDITCLGRHLAFTQKKGKFYEWGIYVPDKRAPERDTFQNYKIISKYNGVEPRRFGGRPNLIGQELAINSEQEFDTWVHGAMAELSDDGKAPEGVTYESVLELTEQIRESLAQ